MRKRSDKDKPTTTVNGAVQQIASTNSTVNLFLGGSQVRSWMNGTAAAAAAPSTVSRVRKLSVVSSSSSKGDNNRPKQTPTTTTTTTILPSPAPSDEPSPARETDSSRVVYEERSARMAPVTRREMAVDAGAERVRSPDEMQMESTMRQGGADSEQPRAVRSPEVQMEAGMGRQEQTPTEMEGGQGRPSNTSRERNTPTESQAVRSSSTTQQMPSMVQQGNRPTASSQDVRFLGARQSSSVNQQTHAHYLPHTVMGPIRQQPPSTIQQSHAVQSPPTGSVLHGYTPVAPAPPSKRRKMTSANHPSLKTMLPIIDQHVESCGGMHAIASNIERQRIRMLQEACRNDDYFYVALHQMFCLWALDPDLVARLTMPNSGAILKAAFTIIAQLIMHNSTINEVHTKFFSVFPNHLSELMYRSDQYSLTVNNVATFLTKLSMEWPTYIPECRQRGYPPLVDELVNRFGLLSPILQHIIFTATRRNIGFPDDEYSAQMEQLFNRDQELHRQMASRVNTAYPPTAREINERNQWQAEQYIHVRAAQLQRMEEARQREMVQMGSNSLHPMSSHLLARVHSPSDMPSAARAGQPHPIRTNVMPSEVLTASPQSTTLPSQHYGRAPPQGQSSHQAPSGSVFERSSRSPMQNTVDRPPLTTPGYPMPSNQQYISSQSQNIQQNLQQAYQQHQAQNMQPRQGQMNDIAWTASRNAPRSAPLSQFPGAGAGAASPLQAGPVRRVTSPSYNSNVASAIANIPAGYSSAQPQQQVGLTPLIPPVGYIPPYQFPQPDRTALHQAHLRSPVLRPIDADEALAADQTPQRYYQAVQGFAAGPETLKDSPLLTELTFVVPRPVYRDIAEDKASDPSAPLLREIRQGTLQYRVRCCRVIKGTEMEPSDFVVADTNWPPTIFMEINNSVLEVRRKNHHGKDRPVDITYHVFDCGPKKENMLRISVPRPAKTSSDMLYSLAIEVVEVFRHQQIIDMCLTAQRITAKDMIASIRAKLTDTPASADDDVALVSANLTIDLADPFTARIFAVPVRGAHCRHRECFDLETFLVSRTTKPLEAACAPDVWKCPLCGADARPRSLRVDEFLVGVRERLEREGGLEAKAILVTEDGEWTVKPEGAPAGRRKSRASAARSVPREEGGKDGSPPVQASRQGSRVVEVIEVDDD
ncbi:hypothetical protein VE03_10107 [Pseudogymnoascus sp. 23342-1-I1]|nr:hypothetical protein VE03_10107 [Pseudogymnoascus sp. 23342-1-I1]